MSEFSDELLSVYLDGEATDAERALVEERLASDPAARQLLEELRGAADAVRSLPLRTLDAEFSRDVLAAIEAESPRPAAQRDDCAPEPFWKRPGVKRGLAWGSLAAAATFVLVQIQPDREGLDNREVAQAPEEQADRSESEAAVDRQRAPLALKSATPEATSAEPAGVGGRASEMSSQAGELGDDRKLAVAAPPAPATIEAAASRSAADMLDMSEMTANRSSRSAALASRALGGGAIFGLTQPLRIVVHNDLAAEEANLLARLDAAGVEVRHARAASRKTAAIEQPRRQEEQDQTAAASETRSDVAAEAERIAESPAKMIAYVVVGDSAVLEGLRRQLTQTDKKDRAAASDFDSQGRTAAGSRQASDEVRRNAWAMRITSADEANDALRNELPPEGGEPATTQLVIVLQSSPPPAATGAAPR